MAKRYLFVVLLLCGWVGCSNAPEKPDNLIPEQKYVNLLVEKQLLRTFSKYGETDSTKTSSLSKVVYKTYNISDQQFMDSHHYYQQFPDEQKERVDKAIDKLKEQLMLEKSVSDSTRIDSTKEKTKN